MCSPLDGAGTAGGGIAAFPAGELEILDLSDDGRGIGRLDGMAVFVPDLIPGDTALVTVTAFKKRYAVGKTEKLLRRSPNRIPPACPYTWQCGGCSLQEMEYAAQLRIKERHVREKLMRIGGMREPALQPVLAMETPRNYRNKAQYAVEYGKGAEVRVGFYGAGSRRTADIPCCRIQAAPADAVADALRRFLLSRPAARKTGAADARGKAQDLPAGGSLPLIDRLTVRTAFETGEVMAILAGAEEKMPGLARLIAMMDEAVAALPPFGDGAEFSLESVILQGGATGKAGNGAGSKADGNCLAAAGKPVIAERMGGLDFEVSPLSFYQVNPVQARALAAQVVKYAALSGGETVFDLYCGVGSLGLFCAAGARRVIGVESARQAVSDANRNAVINGIVNAAFVCGKAEQALPELLEEERADVVILDPPRAGCSPELLRAITEAAPQRIVYASCDPATLARDVKQITGAGYTFTEGTPIDMFPHTLHVETVVLLQRADA